MPSRFYSTSLSQPLPFNVSAITYVRTRRLALKPQPSSLKLVKGENSPSCSVEIPSDHGVKPVELSGRSNQTVSYNFRLRKKDSGGEVRTRTSESYHPTLVSFHGSRPGPKIRLPNNRKVFSEWAERIEEDLRAWALTPDSMLIHTAGVGVGDFQAQGLPNAMQAQKRNRWLRAGPNTRSTPLKYGQAFKETKATLPNLLQRRRRKGSASESWNRGARHDESNDLNDTGLFGEEYAETFRTTAIAKDPTARSFWTVLHKARSSPGQREQRLTDADDSLVAPENVAKDGKGNPVLMFSATEQRQMQSTGRSPAPKTKPKEDKHLPHLTDSGEAHMVAVTQKRTTKRRAIAIGTVTFSEDGTAGLVQNALIKKGDVLGTARLAGIMAAKNCPWLIPLCHPIMLSGVRVDVKLFKAEQRNGSFGGVCVEAEVECVGQTGVEMEALTAVTGALLTVIDMVKGVDRGTKIDGVRLVLKEGGSSGLYQDAAWAAERNIGGEG